MAVDDARVQAYFLRQSLSGADIVLQSDGTMRRTYTYISDAAAAVLCLLLAEDSDTFNIANDDAGVSIRELAETFQRQQSRAGRLRADQAPNRHRVVEPQPGGTFLDCSRLRGTGWTPRVSIDDGVARTMRHHLDAGYMGTLRRRTSGVHRAGAPRTAMGVRADAGSRSANRRADPCHRAR